MSARLETIQAKDLTVNHLYLIVEVQTDQSHHLGQLLGITRNEISSDIYIGPREHSRIVNVLNDSDVVLLDPPKADRVLHHFAD